MAFLLRKKLVCPTCNRSFEVEIVNGTGPHSRKGDIPSRSYLSAGEMLKGSGGTLLCPHDKTELWKNKPGKKALISEFDHLAIAAPTREIGEAYLKEKTGVQASKGGEHDQMGTHNSLTRLSDKSYLEVIATNPDVDGPDRPRWFDLDNFQPPARLYTWIASTTDIQTCINAAKEIGVDYGEPVSLTRGNLSWQMAIRPDGTLPMGGAAPLIIQWGRNQLHPRLKIKDHGLRLKGLTAYTPDPERLQDLLEAIGMRDLLLIIKQSKSPSIEARFKTSDGKIVSL